MGDFGKTLAATVAGGLIAAATAGGVAYYTTRQAADAESRRALGAARLLVDDLRRAEGDFGNSLTDCRYELNDLNIELSPDGLALLAWRFHAKEWLPVALAISGLRVQIGRSRVRHLFTHDDVIQIESVIKQIDQAGPSLGGAAGETLFTKDQVKQTLAHVGPACAK
jgi:hypothetical protein